MTVWVVVGMDAAGKLDVMEVFTNEGMAVGYASDYNAVAPKGCCAGIIKREVRESVKHGN